MFEPLWPLTIHHTVLQTHTCDAYMEKVVRAAHIFSLCFSNFISLSPKLNNMLKYSHSQWSLYRSRRRSHNVGDKAIHQFYKYEKKKTKNQNIFRSRKCNMECRRTRKLKRKYGRTSMEKSAAAPASSVLAISKLQTLIYIYVRNDRTCAHSVTATQL